MKFEFNLSGSPEPVTPRPLSELLHPSLPPASWTIGGTGIWDSLMEMCLAMINTISSPEGAKPDFTLTPSCLWTLEPFEPGKNTSLDRIESILNLYSEENAGVFLNFDNPRLQQRDLEDSYGNALFELLLSANARHLHGVYVASDLLARHLRQKCPGLNIRLGMNRLLMEKKRDASFYNMLATKFNRIAIDPRDTLDAKLLSRLREKKKFEITVNDPGIFPMAGREAFWEAVCKLKREPWNMDLVSKCKNLFSKWTGGCSPLLPPGCRPLCLSQQEIDTLIHMGFRHFRIQSETIRSELAMAWAITRWFLNPDSSLSHRKAVIEYGILGHRPGEAHKLPTGTGNYFFRNSEMQT